MVQYRAIHPQPVSCKQRCRVLLEDAGAGADLAPVVRGEEKEKGKAAFRATLCSNSTALCPVIMHHSRYRVLLLPGSVLRVPT